LKLTSTHGKDAQGDNEAATPVRLQRQGYDATVGGRSALFLLFIEPELADMTIIWTILIGFIAGVIAKLVTAGDNKPSGFILTTLLGILGAFVATWLGQQIGWYGQDEAAGLIGAIIGAIIVLVVWGFIQNSLERNRTGA
jgi:uncharacterized membrane protein YeaQ/YmgE (transglycosylase-associated protein family)